ncbi:MAG: sensor histidine kinase [Candidatus Kapaibacteriales bacterium]
MRKWIKLSDLFSLVPARIQYENFWKEIRKRNLWFIQLRYFALLLLFFLIIGTELLRKFIPNFKVNVLALISILCVILTYNLIFHYLWKIFPKISQKIKVHSLHFSLLQICFDLLSLSMLVYFTGGIESPLSTFFVFHTILGSLLLPGNVITLLITIVILLNVSVSIGELYNVFPHQQISGFIEHSLYNNLNYLIVFYFTFSIVVYISIYLANSIAKVLYERERSLTIAINELQEAERNKSRYVMNVVHDLKTPISASLTWIDILLEGKIYSIPEYILNPLKKIQHRLKGAMSMINDILTISQVKVMNELKQIKGVELVSLINEIFQNFRILFASKNIDVKISASKPEILIITDPKLLALALSNVISNAQKYTENNGIVEIKVEDLLDEVEISIADNGIGIPSKEIDKIFDEFYRSSVSRQRGIEGTGLGMALVKGTLERLKGTIRIKSPSYLGNQDRPGTQVIIKVPKRYN